MRVLVCEDETIIRLDLCQLLESAGLTVVGEARDGAEAVRLAEELTPDIILMDVRMPELDGVEAARRILAERQVPIVMVTAFAERDIVQQASEAGAFGYLVKPFRQDDVLAAITTAQARSTELADARKEAKSLGEALETRKVVERAKGMLMTAREHQRAGRLRAHALRLAAHRPAHAGDRRSAAGDTLRREVIRRHAILIAGLALTAVAGILHTVVSDTAGTIAASMPLLLVAPIVAKGTDALRGRLSTSVVGIVQSGFGNIAELAITILALRANLPEVVKLAIVGSLLGQRRAAGRRRGPAPARARRPRRVAALRPAPVLGYHDAEHDRVPADGDPQRAERPARERRPPGHLAGGGHRADRRRRAVHPDGAPGAARAAGGHDEALRPAHSAPGSCISASAG